ncbi:MAG: hypothetical protein HY719_05980 [Planctomycetes bacterium]|nr:hypothetical protein [Planctomycetota bacterium]
MPHRAPLILVPAALLALAAGCETNPITNRRDYDAEMRDLAARVLGPAMETPKKERASVVSYWEVRQPLDIEEKAWKVVGYLEEQEVRRDWEDVVYHLYTVRDLSLAARAVVDGDSLDYYDHAEFAEPYPMAPVRMPLELAAQRALRLSSRVSLVERSADHFQHLAQEAKGYQVLGKDGKTVEREVIGMDQLFREYVNRPEPPPLSLDEPRRPTKFEPGGAAAPPPGPEALPGAAPAAPPADGGETPPGPGGG